MKYALETLIKKQIELENRIRTSEAFIDSISGYVDTNVIEMYRDDLEGLKSKLNDITNALKCLDNTGL